ncbi:Hydrolase [Lachnellula hyalina]|uniref:Hydrolase n=1 Tax=Lachnellula hyalina TaxID=1316788 RepID=A0A8H8U064_9HELO|nr:Hydrolase [Lachnellula hyalina]TVY27040.1 Hydrolase [Lachnellula hyalina]
MSCPACFSGGVSKSHPTGTETSIHGLPTYVAQPADGVTPEGIIVFITDAFGWDFVNNRVLADHYAKRGGFLVYVPDFMNGNSLSPSVLALMDKIMEPGSWLTTVVYKPAYVLQAAIRTIPWLIKTRVSVSKPRVFAYVQALRTSPPPFRTDDLKIGAAGFCWGGKHAILLAHDTPSSRVQRHPSQLTSTSSTLSPLIDCCFTAHPSSIDVPADVDAITIPTSVAIGDSDMALKTPLIQQMKRILEDKKRGDHEVVVMEGAKHGFAVRTHPDDVHEMECAEKAEVQAVEWFGKWFA